MTSVYLLSNHETNILSTYTNNRNIIISSRCKEQIVQFKNILSTHHLKYGRWINECVQYDQNPNDVASIQMKTSQHAKCAYNPKLKICEIDFNASHEELKHLFLFRHSDMMIMHTFDYNRVNDILTIQGVHLKTHELFVPQDDDEWCYLESCWNR